MKYAELKRLELNLKNVHSTLAGRLQKDLIRYGELTDEERSCEDLQYFLRLRVRTVVLHHLEEQTKISWKMCALSRPSTTVCSECTATTR